jgi:hypothetical protein
MIEIFPDKIEISPSNRATCRMCSKFIGKGEPRLTENYAYRDQTVSAHFCFRCVIKKINTSKGRLRLIEQQLSILESNFDKLMEPDEMKKLILANAVAGIPGGTNVKRRKK